jgi:hypothetical protein
MNAHQYISRIATVLLLTGAVAFAQEKKPTVAKPAAKPAAAAAHAPSVSKGPSTAGGTASKGPTTAGHTPTTTTTAGRGPSTTTTAGRGPSTNTAGRGVTSGNNAGHTPTPANGRGVSNVSNRNNNIGSNRTPTGNRTVRTSNGSTMRTRPNGSRAEFHDTKRGMDVHHGLDGRRRVSVERADHSRVYAERGGRGYVQRPYMYHGHEYGHRTYYYNGRAYDRFYNRYPYHGVYVYGYTPAFYYAPAFYGWAYNPWLAPVPYAWGYVGTPWYGFYGGYFTPYPVYPSASVWLADYLLSQSLEANYAAQQAAAQGGGAPPPQQAMAPDAAPLTPEVKAMIADEVKRQLALENAEAQQTAQKQEIDPASSGIARMLSDNQPHVFVAGASLDVIDANGTECAVTEGDALQLAGAPAAEATAADLMVLSSKGGQECHKGAKVSVAIADLQDMQNHMRETIDAGLTDLQQKGGQGGLPQVPASAKAPPVKAEFAAVAPPPDPNAAAEINGQVAEADKAEQEIASQAPADASGPSSTPAPAATAPPSEVDLTGQTIAQVKALMGEPKSVATAGTKTIYVYKDMKVIFTAGKVTDVQ